jgi:hypothetical protein
VTTPHPDIPHSSRPGHTADDGATTPVRLRVRHSAAPGSLLTGTSRGDGAARSWAGAAGGGPTRSRPPRTPRVPGTSAVPATNQPAASCWSRPRRRCPRRDSRSMSTSTTARHQSTTLTPAPPDARPTGATRRRRRRTASPPPPRRETDHAATPAAPLAVTAQTGHGPPYRRHDPERVRTRVRQLFAARGRVERETVRHRARSPATGPTDGTDAGRRLAGLSAAPAAPPTPRPASSSSRRAVSRPSRHPSRQAPAQRVRAGNAESACGEVPALLLVRLRRPLAEPAVRPSTQRALHGFCRQALPHVAQGLGILLPRHR